MSLVIKRTILLGLIISLFSCVKNDETLPGIDPKTEGYNSFLIKKIKILSINSSSNKWYTVKDDNNLTYQTSSQTYVDKNNLPAEITDYNLIQSNAVPNSKFSSQITITIKNGASSDGEFTFTPTNVLGNGTIQMNDSNTGLTANVEFIWY